jgi:hypothetical protein
VADLAIQVAGREHAAEAAEILARAFHDDPVFGWLFPAEGSRHQRLRRFFVTELHHESLRHGAVEVARVDGRVAGAAMWLPPGAPLGTQASALPGYLRAFGRQLMIASQYQSAAVAARPRAEPHFGFRVAGTLGLPEGAPVVTAMWRPGLVRVA